MANRVDASGRAYAGSQRHIQTYVNWHPEELNAAIFQAIPEMREGGAAINWVSPLARRSISVNTGTGRFSRGSGFRIWPGNSPSTGQAVDHGGTRSRD